MKQPEHLHLYVCNIHNVHTCRKNHAMYRGSCNVQWHIHVRFLFSIEKSTRYCQLHTFVINVTCIDWAEITGRLRYDEVTESGCMSRLYSMHSQHGDDSTESFKRNSVDFVVSGLSQPTTMSYLHRYLQICPTGHEMCLSHKRLYLYQLLPKML